jgi:hypothetical protein
MPGVRGDLMDWAAVREGSSKSAAAKNVNESILLGWVMVRLLKPSLPCNSEKAAKLAHQFLRSDGASGRTVSGIAMRCKRQVRPDAK